MLGLSFAVTQEWTQTCRWELEKRSFNNKIMLRDLGSVAQEWRVWQRNGGLSWCRVVWLKVWETLAKTH